MARPAWAVWLAEGWVPHDTMASVAGCHSLKGSVTDESAIDWFAPPYMYTAMEFRGT